MYIIKSHLFSGCLQVQFLVYRLQLVTQPGVFRVCQALMRRTLGIQQGKKSKQHQPIPVPGKEKNTLLFNQSNYLPKKPPPWKHKKWGEKTRMRQIRLTILIQGSCWTNKSCRTMRMLLFKNFAKQRTIFRFFQLFSAGLRYTLLFLQMGWKFHWQDSFNRGEDKVSNGCNFPVERLEASKRI